MQLASRNGIMAPTLFFPFSLDHITMPWFSTAFTGTNHWRLTLFTASKSIMSAGGADACLPPSPPPGTPPPPPSSPFSGPGAPPSRRFFFFFSLREEPCDEIAVEWVAGTGELK